MYKIWGKLIENNKLIDEITFDISEKDYLTRNLDGYIEDICNKLDIQNPIILDKHKKDLQRYQKTDFLAESFLEPIEFDKFEIEIYEL